MSYVIHPFTGKVKETPEGFAVGCLFFGFFPMLFRGDFVTFFIGSIVEIIMFFVLISAHPALGLIWILGVPVVLGFFYNLYYRDLLMSNGYVHYEQPRFPPGQTGA